MIKLILPDGSERVYNSEILAKEAVQDISMGLYREALGVVVNGKTLGMNDTIKEGGDFKVVKFTDKEGKAIFWHTSSHVLAAAIQRLYPQTKFAIGPAIADGFYYDIDLDEKLTEDDLEKIEKEAMKIARENLDVEKFLEKKP